MKLSKLLPRLFGRRKTAGTGSIEASELDRLLRDGAALTILDVRGGDEFAGPLGHIPGALNIPLGEIPERMSEIAARGGDPVIVVCRTDKRSGLAAQLLEEAKVRNLRILRGGMERWNRGGHDHAR